MHKSYKILLLTFSTFLCSLGCSEVAEPSIMKEEPLVSEGCTTVSLLESFVDTNGNHLFIYQDGKVFLQDNANCQFQLQYFDPDFESANYTANASGIFINDGSQLVSVRNNFFENFEKPEFFDLYVSDISSDNLFWTSFTLQSPETKTVAEYVALSKCILDKTCDFLDNQITIIEDPTDASNKVIEFNCVGPTEEMVTSKCSITSVLNYFKNENEVWYEADYFIKSGMPYSIVDFETSYFEGSPGPRVVIRNNKLEFENKFGAKLRFESNTSTEIPIEKWFTVKVHLNFSNTNTGVLELWQDGVQMISASGINLPTSNAIQNVLEVGISATQENTILLMDNLRISDTAF